MTSSGCEVLDEYPSRYIGYILNDKRLRAKIYDMDSLVKVVRQVFKSDQSLSEIIKDIDKKGIDLSVCLDTMFNTIDIQKLIETNTKQKETEIKQRVKRDKPSLRGRALSKEIQKRLKQSIGVSKAQVKKTKQVTIQDALRPITVKEYKRKRKVVKKYSKTKHRPLTKAEEMLINNNIRKRPSEVVQIYLKSGLRFRTAESVKKHYYRIKWKRAGKTIY